MRRLLSLALLLAAGCHLVKNPNDLEIKGGARCQTDAELCGGVGQACGIKKSLQDECGTVVPELWCGGCGMASLCGYTNNAAPAPNTCMPSPFAGKPIGPFARVSPAAGFAATGNALLAWDGATWHTRATAERPDPLIRLAAVTMDRLSAISPLDLFVLEGPTLRQVMSAPVGTHFVDIAYQASNDTTFVATDKEVWRQSTSTGNWDYTGVADLIANPDLRALGFIGDVLFVVNGSNQLISVKPWGDRSADFPTQSSVGGFSGNNLDDVWAAISDASGSYVFHRGVAGWSPIFTAANAVTLNGIAGPFDGGDKVWISGTRQTVLFCDRVHCEFDKAIPADQQLAADYYGIGGVPLRDGRFDLWVGTDRGSVLQWRE